MRPDIMQFKISDDSSGLLRDLDSFPPATLVDDLLTVAGWLKRHCSPNPQTANYMFGLKGAREKEDSIGIRER
eukprot:6024386-Amphidinium_carterae.2